MTMNYPYGLQPRTFLLSKREWAADSVQASTMRTTASRPLALTNGTIQEDTIPLKGRTQIRPQPPSTSPPKRRRSNRPFESVTDWTVSAPGGLDPSNVYRPRKQHHLPPMDSHRASRSGRSSVVRARSLIRANQQASLRYEMAVEAAERQTLEHEELRERQLQQEHIVAQIPPFEEAEGDEEDKTTSVEALSLHTLYEEETETCLPVSPINDEQNSQDSARGAPPLCACRDWDAVQQCRCDVARNLVDDVLSFWENEREIDDEPEQDEREIEQSTQQQTEPTARSVDCACATQHDIDECRSQQAAELVTLVLSHALHNQVSPSAAPQALADVAELRQREAEALVDDLLASIQVIPANVCMCHSDEDIRSCREKFLGCMVSDVLAGYV